MQLQIDSRKLHEDSIGLVFSPALLVAGRVTVVVASGLLPQIHGTLSFKPGCG